MSGSHCPLEKGSREVSVPTGRAQPHPSSQANTRPSRAKLVKLGPAPHPGPSAMGSAGDAARARCRFRAHISNPIKSLFPLHGSRGRWTHTP